MKLALLDMCLLNILVDMYMHMFTGELLEGIAQHASPWPAPWRPGSVAQGVVELMGGGAVVYEGERDPGERLERD